jgi:hypothetical protein
VVLGFGLGSRVLGKGSTPSTRALYPPGGERLGKNPTGIMHVVKPFMHYYCQRAEHIHLMLSSPILTLLLEPIVLHASVNRLDAGCCRPLKMGMQTYITQPHMCCLH